MATPRLPFLYPTLLRAVRSCEPATHRSIRISSKTKHAPFHSSRRNAQETYHRRYGPAAEANLPPPGRPKEESSDQQSSTPPATKDGESNKESAPPEQSQSKQNDADEVQETSARYKDEQHSAAETTPDQTPDESEMQQEDALLPSEGNQASSTGDNASEEPFAPRPHPLGANPLDGVLHMPSPSAHLTPTSSPTSDGKPHLSPAPYVHHFDTYSLVRDLSKGGFTDDQSVTIMKAVRRILQNNLDLARTSLTSKSDVENESYLFQAACSELQQSLQTARGSEMQRQRASRTQLQHESDILSQRLNQELAGLKDDIKGMFNDHKMATRENQRSIDTSVQELNYKITVSLNSDGKSEIEGLRWILTRRAALAIATSAAMIILFLKYYSVLRTQEIVAEKKKEAPANKENTPKQPAPSAESQQPPISVLEAHVSESLG